MWNDKMREDFQHMFDDVGLNYSSLQVEQVFQLLSLYECRDTVRQGVMDKTKPQLIEDLSQSAHQFLAFTAYLQSTFMRPLKLERTDIKDPDTLDLAALKRCAQELGMVAELKPKLKVYPSVIVLGAFQFRIEQRMLYFIRLVQSGVITGVKHLLLSVGDRLLADFEPAKKEGAKTEAEMAKMVVTKLIGEFPEVFKDIRVNYHNAQKKPEATRAHTDDAAEETAKMYQQESPVLIISNQPFCQYQHETHRIPFHPTPIETIGDEASAEYNGWNYCDSFSRFMYCTARRYLMLDCGMDAKKAGYIIDEYKKQYTCDSSLYFGGKVREELLVVKQEDGVSLNIK